MQHFFYALLILWGGGINPVLSQQRPAQPRQPRRAASNADYLILCVLTYLSPLTRPAAKVGKDFFKLGVARELKSGC